MLVVLSFVCCYWQNIYAVVVTSSIVIIKPLSQPSCYSFGQNYNSQPTAMAIKENFRSWTQWTFYGVYYWSAKKQTQTCLKRITRLFSVVVLVVVAVLFYWCLHVGSHDVRWQPMRLECREELQMRTKTAKFKVVIDMFCDANITQSLAHIWTPSIKES